jgi:malate/lactate dehydrogenase
LFKIRKIRTGMLVKRRALQRNLLERAIKEPAIAIVTAKTSASAARAAIRVTRSKLPISRSEGRVVKIAAIVTEVY